MSDVNSLSHTSWNCKYHIVFVPKYRRKVFYWEKRREIGKILRTLCNWKKVKISEAEVCLEHIHMLLEIPPKIAVSSFMGYLKGKSSLMIYEKFPDLKYKYRNREFWCRGYYVDTASKNAKKIQEYIQRRWKPLNNAPKVKIKFWRLFFVPKLWWQKYAAGRERWMLWNRQQFLDCGKTFVCNQLVGNIFLLPKMGIEQILLMYSKKHLWP